MLGSVIAATAAPMSWLVQWAIGLRAAVSVASERQRHTWDSLLTSPLQGREIILGKFGGSLYALRWLLGSVVLSWVVAAAFGEFGLWQLFVRVLETLLGAALVAAVGVQFSLLNTSAARAMAYTLGIWLAAAIGTTIVAGVGTVVLLLMTISVLLVVSLVWETLAGSPLNIVAGQVFGAYFSFLYLAVETTIYVTATVSIVGWLARNFDRMAGRGWKRSPPERPVWVDSTGKLAVLPTTD